MESTPLQCTLQSSSPCRKVNDIIHVNDKYSHVNISFQRTIRVADGKDTSALPPSMGMYIRHLKNPILDPPRELRENLEPYLRGTLALQLSILSVCNC